MQCHGADAGNIQQTLHCDVCEQVPNGMMVTGNGMVPMANQNPHMPGMVPIMQSPQMPPAMQGSVRSMSAEVCQSSLPVNQLFEPLSWSVGTKSFLFPSAACT